MRPVVVGDRIYVRQLIREGPVLLCLNCSDGKHVWVHQPPRDEDIVSDPHIAQGKLFALTLLDSRRGEDRLRLTSYALDTGETLGARDLVGIRQSWRQRRFCRTTQLEDSLIASLGGLVMRIDLTGSVRWARRQVLLPPGEERTWVAQRFDRPLVAQNQVVIASPGVRTVDCLDAESGRLQWRRVLPHIDRLVGVAAERVIVHAGDEFLALRLETGDADWRRQLLSPFDAELHGGPNGLLLAHKVESPDANNQFRPELVWLDPQTGEMRGRAVLSDLNHTDPRFGPLIAHQDKLWAFYGEGIQQPHRDVVQLTADGEAAPPDAAASDPDIWTEHVNDELRAAAEKVVPQWELLATAHYGGFGFVPQVHGEKQLVALPANNVSPVVFARRIRVPQSGKPKLKMRLGSEPHNNWQLVVRFGEKVLLEKDMEWSKNPNVWKDVAVDLAGVRGQQAWLTVEARFVSHGDHTRTYWKRLELAF